MNYEKQNWVDHIEDSETGEVFQEGVELSSYEDIKDHMSFGLSLAKRSERHLIAEIKSIVQQGGKLTFKDGPIHAYVVDNSDLLNDSMVEMEVRHLNVSDEHLFAFLALPTEKECTKEEALAYPEQRNLISGWYELNPKNFFGLLLPTLCNIRGSLK